MVEHIEEEEKDGTAKKLTKSQKKRLKRKVTHIPLNYFNNFFRRLLIINMRNLDLQSLLYNKFNNKKRPKKRLTSGHKFKKRKSQNVKSKRKKLQDNNKTKRKHRKKQKT